MDRLPGTLRWNPWALADAACVVAFVAIGRRSHDSDLAGTIGVAAPFLIALLISAVAALAAETRGRSAYTSARTGVVVWLGTWGFGMLLRRLIFDRGTATAFVVVAFVALGVTMLAWRAVRAGLGDVGRGSIDTDGSGAGH